jgi:hypothetical protein
MEEAVALCGPQHHREVKEKNSRYGNSNNEVLNIYTLLSTMGFAPFI